jgi:hypothetical protein
LDIHGEDCPISALGLDYRKNYLIHFEVSEISEAEGFNEYQPTKEHPDKPSVLKKADRAFINVLQGPDALIWLGDLTRRTFKKVYNETPAENFFEEWRFTTELPENIDTKHKWILFEGTRKKQRPSQLAREQARMIAQAIWKDDNSIPVPIMAERGEIVAVAKDYTKGTVMKWLRGANPNPKPGRPRRKR